MEVASTRRFRVQVCCQELARKAISEEMTEKELQKAVSVPRSAISEAPGVCGRCRGAYDQPGDQHQELEAQSHRHRGPEMNAIYLRFHRLSSVYKHVIVLDELLK